MTQPQPTLTLAPWELPPDCDAPLTAPADFVFRSRWQKGVVINPRKTEIWLRVVPYRGAFIHYFCDGERPQNGNWVLSNNEDYNPFSTEIRDFNTLKQLFWARTYMDLWYGSIMRLIYFEGTPYGYPGIYRATIDAGSRGLISSNTDPLEEWPSRREARFKLDVENDDTPWIRIRIRKGKRVRNRLLREPGNEKSRVYFALQWLHLDLEQKRARALQFERGDIAEMQTILRAALQTQSDVWEDGDTLIWKTSYSKYSAIEKEMQDGLLAVRHGWTLDIPPRLKVWKRIIWSYFHPAIEDEKIDGCEDHLNNYLFVAGHSFSHSLDTFIVLASPPSMHERLEAELILRQWWEQKFVPVLFDGASGSMPPCP